jgi:hypothetical protein
MAQLLLNWMEVVAGNQFLLNTAAKGGLFMLAIARDKGVSMQKTKRKNVSRLGHRRFSMRHVLSAVLVAGVAMLLAVVNPASAATILSNFVNQDALCGSGGCFNSTYSLVIDDGGTTDNNYSATLTVDASLYNGPGTFISAVDFKVSSTLISATLTSAPGGVGGWTTVVNDGQASAECSGSGGGFGTSCDPPPTTLAPVPHAPYTWTWDFTTTATIGFGHIGVKYDNAAGNLNGNIISISEVQATPEPSSTILLGLALISVVGLGGYRYCRV